MRLGARSNLLAGLLGLLTATAPAQAQIGEIPLLDSLFVARLLPRQLARLDVPIHPQLAPSPDGRHLAAVQVRPQPILWVVPTAGGEAFSFREMWAAYHARWSPAGQRIGFIAAIGPPRIWTVEVDPESGRAIDPPRLLIRTGANAFAFAPDGERIALVTSRSTAAGASEIHIVDWASRRYRVLLRESGLIYRLDWSADGAHLFYGLLPESRHGDEAASIVRAAIQNGTRKTIKEAADFLGLSPDGSRLLYRPVGEANAGGRIVEVGPLEPGPVVRLALPADAGDPRWSSDSASLVVVRARPEGDEIWEIPLPGPSGP